VGSTQELWLARELRRSVRARKRWQMVGFGTIMGAVRSPAAVAGWIQPDAPDLIRNRVRAALAAARAGLPSEFDGWGGYPAARTRFLNAAQQAGADLIVVAGDSHNSWAFELTQDGKPAGVEFDGQSVTSPGFENYFPKTAPADISRALVETNAELKWAETSGRGYLTVTLTPAAATGEWLFLDTIRERSPRIARTHRMRTRAGRRRLELG
jgi:alkaline phosphatase D